MGWPYQQKPPMGWPLDYDSGLVPTAGYWPMPEGSGNKVYDLSGNGNTGTIVNALWTPGKFGSCLSFDGTEDYVQLAKKYQPTAAGFRDVGLTISAWYKGTVSQAQAGLATQGFGNHLWGSYGLFMVSGKARMSAYASGVAYRQADSDSTINDGKWYHIIGIVNNSAQEVALYVDGVKQTDTDSWLATDDYEADSVVEYQNFLIGAQEKASIVNYLNGSIDNVMIYDRALSASEIALLYRYPFYMYKDPAEIALLGGYQVTPSVTGIMTTNTGYWGSI